MGINTEYIKGLSEQIKDCNTCEELQEAAAKATQALQDQLAGIMKQMEFLEPYLALLSPPSLDDVPTWISDFIKTVIEPMTKPFFEYQIQLAEMTAAISEITSAIQDAASSFQNCSIAIKSSNDDENPIPTP